MPKTTLHQLNDFGQSIWLDYISKSLMESGKLQKLIDQGLRGMTSNPSIFNQAISQGHEYDDEIVKLKKQGKSTFEIYDELTVRDIQKACDIFKPVFTVSQKLDGYVSLEINPQLANKISEQAKEGQRLWKKVGRENLMIKVPSTEEGFPVIEDLIAQGINVNVTLIFCAGGRVSLRVITALSGPMGSYGFSISQDQPGTINIRHNMFSGAQAIGYV